MMNGTEPAGKAARAPALQVIVLGSGGGPQESNTTAFLVRSTAEGWRRGSVVAVDAGVHLSSITKILERTLPLGLNEATSSTDEDDVSSTASGLSLPFTLETGPFTGLEVPFASAEANASHIQRTLVDTYLITHPHLDHIAGFVINTAGLPGARPKRLAGLPSTIHAFKTHIFNNVIWPNLSDENNGAGLVTYMRLVEGGPPSLGEGDDRGYLEISDGLAVKTWAVSHGHCIERHTHRGSGVSMSRVGSIDGSAAGGMLSHRAIAHHNHSISMGFNSPFAQPPQSVPTLHVPQTLPIRHDSVAIGRRASQAVTSAALPPPMEHVCVYDSCAYFLRDLKTGREVIIFGDVEPDSVSLSPRNLQIWQEAAPKIASGHLTGIFIECSYDDSQPVERLYGHLTPKYIIEELRTLADEVEEARIILHEQEEEEKQKKKDREAKRRKRKAEEAAAGIHSSRKGHGHSHLKPADVSASDSKHGYAEPVSPRTMKPQRVAFAEPESPKSVPALSTNITDLSLNESEFSLSDEKGGPKDISIAVPATVTQETAKPVEAKLPLLGVKIVIIHVKEKLKDGPSAGEVILEQLEEQDAESPLGCEFQISYSGQSIFF